MDFKKIKFSETKNIAYVFNRFYKGAILHFPLARWVHIEWSVGMSMAMYDLMFWAKIVIVFWNGQMVLPKTCLLINKIFWKASNFQMRFQSQFFDTDFSVLWALGFSKKYIVWCNIFYWTMKVESR